MVSPRYATASLLAILLLSLPARAEDTYFSVRIPDLPLVNNAKLPEQTTREGENSATIAERRLLLRPHVLLDGPGEAFLGWIDPSEIERIHPRRSAGIWAIPRRDGRDEFFLAARAPAGKDLSGRLAWQKADASGMVLLPFRIPAEKADAAKHRADFLRAKGDHYEGLYRRELPGGAWYRLQTQLTRAEQDVEAPGAAGEDAPRLRDRSLTPNDTYELFTGGRAMAENLQLDREFLENLNEESTSPESPAPERKDAKASVKLKDIAGITVREMDWAARIAGLKPKLDPTAAKIPADQHVVFFASFQAFLAVADEAQKHDLPVLRMASPRSEDAKIVERYQRQLGLPLSELARKIGPTLVASVALTGSDPYFPMGTDVAVLFESPQPQALSSLLSARIALAAAKEKDVKPVQGEIEGIAYRGWRSPDRTVCSYTIALDNIVVVTNSPAQLAQLVRAHRKQVPTIPELPEYVFFRNRYPRGDAEETALLFLSDATIRRWCGPRWRIADSRRTRVAAVMADMQASQMDALATERVKPGTIHTPWPTPAAGEWSVGPAGVASSVYGSLPFMTPIVEIPLDEATSGEASAYERWRAGYQSNWSGAFDPIALRIGLGKTRLSTDLTVMPLIADSKYNSVKQITGNQKIRPEALDMHEATLHVGMAIDRQAPMFRQAENLIPRLEDVAQNVTLGWIGSTASLYVDDDPFWAELFSSRNEADFAKQLFQHIDHIPIALRIECVDGLKLAAFLTWLRGTMEATAPGAVQWETPRHRDLPYVKITSDARHAPGILPFGSKLAIHYAILDGALVVTPNEKTLHRAIDRTLARREAKKAGAAATAPSATAATPAAKDAKPAAAPKPTLGDSVILRIRRPLPELIRTAMRDHYRNTLQAQSWDNLPILNEWKQRYPDRDPIEVHRRVWGVEPVCPGGGRYVWNETFRTMESTVYGHPGEPKPGPDMPPAFGVFTSADFGLTFEPDGLRARAVLEADAQPAGENATKAK